MAVTQSMVSSSELEFKELGLKSLQAHGSPRQEGTDLGEW